MVQLEVVVLLDTPNGHRYSFFTRTGAGFYEAFGQGLSIAGELVSVSFGAVNGDGINDLSMVRGGDEIMVALGDGEGNSLGQLYISLGQQMEDLQHILVDLNQDGFFDLVIWNEDGSVPIKKYMINEGNSFTDATNVKPANSYSRIVTFGDLYNSGIPQLVFLNSAGELQWKDNDGNGNFGNEVTILSENMAASIRHIVMDDFNGDGATNIVFSKPTADTFDNYMIIDQIVMLPSQMVSGTTVNGFVYYDQNENGIYDEGDLPAAYIPIGVENNDALTYSLPNSNYFLANLGGGPVSITSMLAASMWTVSSSPAVYELELTKENNYSASNIDF